MTKPVRGVRSAVWILIIAFIPGSLWAGPIPLKRVVELSLAHATGLAISSADVEKAEAQYRDLRGNYVPQLSTSAGIGYSYGFPLGLAGNAPSLFNINAQSAVFNPSLREFIRAAKIDSAVASLKNKDQRNQIIEDAVLNYIELEKWEQRLVRLQETQRQADQVEAAVSERIKQGVDSDVDGIRARLSAAQVRERVAEAQGSADVVREHLSKLTGLPAGEIETEPESLPDFPAAAPQQPEPEHTAEDHPAVQAAVEHARAQYLRAEGEHRALWPSFDFGAQYALLSRFNNYQQYYIPSKPCIVAAVSVLCTIDTFHQNNATLGVAIRFPFFNSSQRARAQAADADAVLAKRQAEAAKNQISEETLRLQRAVTQMEAARDVAELEYELAQKSLTAVQTRIDAGTANLHDLQAARTQVSERFIALQDITFELQRDQLGVLRSTGELEKWALGTH
jgi:outer membrane protein TolC